MKALHKGISFDSASAVTKSSKTLKSKIINSAEPQIKKINTPYFKPDPIIDTIKQRAQKENMKSEVLLYKPNADHLKNAGRIVQDLLKKHKQAKQKLQKMKDQAQKKQQKACPFQPQKKKLEKYLVPGNIIKRNEVWLNQKRRKQIQRKESLLSDDLGQCTFNPTFVSKKKSVAYLRSRSQSINKSIATLNTHTPRFETKNKSPTNSAFRLSKDISSVRFEFEKKVITNRILNMP